MKLLLIVLTATKKYIHICIYIYIWFLLGDKFLWIYTSVWNLRINYEYWQKALQLHATPTHIILCNFVLYVQAGCTFWKWELVRNTHTHIYIYTYIYILSGQKLYIHIYIWQEKCVCNHHIYIYIYIYIYWHLVFKFRAVVYIRVCGHGGGALSTKITHTYMYMCVYVHIVGISLPDVYKKLMLPHKMA